MEKHAVLDMDERRLDVWYTTAEGEEVHEVWTLSEYGWAPFKDSLLF